MPATDKNQTIAPRFTWQAIGAFLSIGAIIVPYSAFLGYIYRENWLLALNFPTEQLGGELFSYHTTTALFALTISLPLVTWTLLFILSVVVAITAGSFLIDISINFFPDKSKKTRNILEKLQDRIPQFRTPTMDKLLTHKFVIASWILFILVIGLTAPVGSIGQQARLDAKQLESRSFTASVNADLHIAKCALLQSPSEKDALFVAVLVTCSKSHCGIVDKDARRFVVPISDVLRVESKALQVVDSFESACWPSHQTKSHNQP